MSCMFISHYSVALSMSDDNKCKIEQGKRLKNWFGTDWNPSEDKIKQILAEWKKLHDEGIIIRAILSLEKGNKDGKLHYQFYIELKDGKTGCVVQDKLFNKDNRVHLEKRHKTAWEAWRYCSIEKIEDKDKITHIKELIRLGNPPPEKYSKKKSVWPRLYKRIRDGATLGELEMEFLGTVPRNRRHIDDKLLERDIKQYKNVYRPLRVEWWVGPPRSGKTRKAMSLVDKPYMIHRVSDYKNPWDTYSGQKVVVLDEFHGQASLANMLLWLDDYYCELSCRFVNKIGMFDTLIICSNQTFDDIYRPQIDLGDENPKPYAYEGREASVDALFARLDNIEMFGAKNQGLKRETSLPDFDAETENINPFRL